METTAQLSEALGRLGAKEALALARAVELGRLKGKEELPTDLVLAALRPRLREIKAPRVPTLRRLVAGAFAAFLVDVEDEPRLPGRIARAAIAPWWQACRRIAGDEMAALEARLVELHHGSDQPPLDELARAAQDAAAGWTRTLSEQLTTGGDAALRQLFPRRVLQTDVKEIGAVLAMAGALTPALVAIDRSLAASAMLDGRDIVELTPDAVTIAKQHYQALSERHGMGGAYLALAVLNRLRQPWHILRLGRALSWKNEDSLIRDTEFKPVGERLIANLQAAAREAAAVATPRSGLPDLAKLTQLLSRYMEEAEGLLGEFGFRRDSAWGEAILQTRVALFATFDRDFMARLGERVILAQLLPTPRRQPPRAADVQADQPPSAEAIAQALAAARFLFLLVQRGARHGMAQIAREAVESVTIEIDKRAGALIDQLRQTPSDQLAEARVAAAAQVLDAFSDDGRGEVLARRLRNATQISA